MSFVLVVDNDPATCYRYVQVMGAAGMSARTAGTGREGLRLACTDHPSLLLAELRLPDMSGVDLLRQLRANGNGVPVVIATGFGSTMSAVEAMKLGALDYLEKPVVMETLVAILGTARNATTPTTNPARRARPIGASDEVVSNVRVHTAMAILDNRFRDPRLTLRSVASDIGITDEHLCRLWRRHTGSSFVASVRKARVTEAQRLLRTTILSAKEIAFQVGFTSVSRLDHDFKRVCGVSPITYRRSPVSSENLIDREHSK